MIATPRGRKLRWFEPKAFTQAELDSDHFAGLRASFRATPAGAVVAAVCEPPPETAPQRPALYGRISMAEAIRQRTAREQREVPATPAAPNAMCPVAKLLIRSEGQILCGTRRRAWQGLDFIGGMGDQLAGASRYETPSEVLCREVREELPDAPSWFHALVRNLAAAVPFGHADAVVVHRSEHIHFWCLDITSDASPADVLSWVRRDFDEWQRDADASMHKCALLRERSRRLLRREDVKIEPREVDLDGREETTILHSGYMGVGMAFPNDMTIR